MLLKLRVEILWHLTVATKFNLKCVFHWVPGSSFGRTGKGSRQSLGRKLKVLLFQTVLPMKMPRSNPNWRPHRFRLQEQKRELVQGIQPLLHQTWQVFGHLSKRWSSGRWSICRLILTSFNCYQVHQDIYIIESLAIIGFIWLLWPPRLESFSGFREQEQRNMEVHRQRIQDAIKGCSKARYNLVEPR